MKYEDIEKAHHELCSRLQGFAYAYCDVDRHSADADLENLNLLDLLPADTFSKLPRDRDLSLHEIKRLAIKWALSPALSWCAKAVGQAPWSPFVHSFEDYCNWHAGCEIDLFVVGCLRNISVDALAHQIMGFMLVMSIGDEYGH